MKKNVRKSIKEDELMEKVIENKSFEFAVRIVKMAMELKKGQHYELGSQVLKSGTSIGANVAEAQNAQSRRDFVSKLHIAYKEANETEYWLRLLERTEIIETIIAKSLIGDVKEIQRILTAIIKTTNTNI